MKNDKIIKALNTLIIINNDRIAGYETALNATEEPDLKDLFSQFILTSQENKQKLIEEVKSLGGNVITDTLPSGKFFRLWIDVRATLLSKDRIAILNSCDYGEDTAKDTYDDAILNEFKNLCSKHKTMIMAQKSSLNADHLSIKSMRDALILIK